MKEQIFEVCRIFFFALVIFQARRFAVESGERRGRTGALKVCSAWCFGIALVFSFSQGRASCEDYDSGPHGGCYEYADDGYMPTDEQLAATFVFWSLVLGIPALHGVLSARPNAQHPWRKPEEDRSPS